MMTSTTYSQDYEVTIMESGQVLSHHAGLDLTVSWKPGHATETVREFDWAVAQIRAQIVDAPAEETR